MLPSTAKELMNIAIRPNLINQWAQEYFGRGGTLVANDYPISHNCLIARYLNDSFKRYLEPNQMFAMRVTTAAFLVNGLAEEQELVGDDIRYIVKAFDKACCNKIVSGDVVFTLDEILAVIKEGQDEWVLNYDPSQLSRYERSQHAS